MTRFITQDPLNVVNYIITKQNKAEISSQPHLGYMGMAGLNQMIYLLDQYACDVYHCPLVIGTFIRLHAVPSIHELPRICQYYGSAGSDMELTDTAFCLTHDKRIIAEYPAMSSKTLQNGALFRQLDHLTNIMFKQKVSTICRYASCKEVLADA